MSNNNDLPNNKALINQIIAYESGELDTPSVVRLFGKLVHSGQAWSLQGSYGRSAIALINAGYIDNEGNVNAEMLKEFEE